MTNGKTICAIACAGILIAVVVYHAKCRFGDDHIHVVSVSNDGSTTEVFVASDAPFELRLVGPSEETLFSKASSRRIIGYRHCVAFTVGRHDGALILDGRKLPVRVGGNPNLQIGDGDVLGRGIGENLHLDWDDGYMFYWGPTE